MPLILSSNTGSITPAAPVAAIVGEPAGRAGADLRPGAGFFVVLPDRTVDVERACAAEWTPTGSATARTAAHAAMMSARRRRNARERTRVPPTPGDCRPGRPDLSSSMVGHASRGTYAGALNPLLPNAGVWACRRVAQRHWQILEEYGEKYGYRHGEPGAAPRPPTRGPTRGMYFSATAFPTK